MRRRSDNEDRCRRFEKPTPPRDDSLDNVSEDDVAAPPVATLTNPWVDMVRNSEKRKRDLDNSSMFFPRRRLELDPETVTPQSSRRRGRTQPLSPMDVLALATVMACPVRVRNNSDVEECRTDDFRIPEPSMVDVVSETEQQGPDSFLLSRRRRKYPQT